MLVFQIVLISLGNPTTVLPAIDKIVGETLLFILGMATDLGERKLNRVF